MKKRLSDLLARLEASRFAPLVQFVKFGLVGVSNTLINYAVDMLCYYVLLAAMSPEGWARKTIATAIAFLVSTFNAFLLNNRFVFTGGGQSRGEWVKTLLRTYACYALTGLILVPLMKLALTALGVPYWAASLLTLVVTIPLNFLLNKFWAFAGRK